MRPSRPEAQGLRHLAFAVTDIAECVRELTAKGIAVEALRIDELTGKRFTFFADPDGLPRVPRADPSLNSAESGRN